MQNRNDLKDPEISSGVEKIELDDREIVETFNESCVSIVSSLKISPKENCKADVSNDSETILNYFKNHPSIKVIESREKQHLLKKF